MKNLCRCGHREDRHKWRAAECNDHGCPCNVYDPLPTMKVFVCTDHDQHYPVGGASVVVAENEAEARRLLGDALKADGLDPVDFTLDELDITRPQASILVNGDY